MNLVSRQKFYKILLLLNCLHSLQNLQHAACSSERLFICILR